MVDLTARTARAHYLTADYLREDLRDPKGPHKNGQRFSLPRVETGLRDPEGLTEW